VIVGLRSRAYWTHLSTLLNQSTKTLSQRYCVITKLPITRYVGTGWNRPGSHSNGTYPSYDLTTECRGKVGKYQVRDVRIIIITLSRWVIVSPPHHAVLISLLFTFVSLLPLSCDYAPNNHNLTSIWHQIANINSDYCNHIYKATPA
jgi:hypothetical protein